MKIKKKKFELTYLKIIIFAVLIGAYTALMAILSITNDTSFKDITISFEVWILFGILIIMNSKTPKDSALKCFLFFLISQPLVYLIQVPFSDLGWSIFGYYKRWFVWTILTIPMGYFGYYMKKEKWWGLLILTPMLLFLGVHYSIFLRNTMFMFPYHLLSTIFCAVTLIIYPIYIFKNKKLRNIGLIISTLIIISMSVYALLNKQEYNTEILLSGGESGLVFDDSYKVYLENQKLGNVSIEYDNDIEDYLVKASFKKGGKTNLIIEDSKGEKTIFELTVSYDYYDINKK